MSAPVMLVLMSMQSAFATVRVNDDRGGQIGEYLAKYQALRVSGELSTVFAPRHVQCYWAPFREIESVSHQGQSSSFTPPGIPRLEVK